MVFKCIHPYFIIYIPRKCQRTDLNLFFTSTVVCSSANQIRVWRSRRFSKVVSRKLCGLKNFFSYLDGVTDIFLFKYFRKKSFNGIALFT